MTARRSIDDLLADARSRLRRLRPEDVPAAMERGAVVIDTRLPEDRATSGEIPGSVWIPLNTLEWRADPDSEARDPRIGGLDTHLIVVCAQGYSSSLAAARLQDLGFSNATDMIGGFTAWAEAGLPVVPSGASGSTS